MGANTLSVSVRHPGAQMIVRGPVAFDAQGSGHPSACGFRRQDVCFDVSTVMPMVSLGNGIPHLEFDARARRGGMQRMALVRWPTLG